MAEEIWNLMVDCKYGILEQIKPGASCVGVYNDFIRRLDTMKLPPISFVGHGIGLHLHEDPYIGATPTLGRPGEDALIEENMVLAVEPGVYWDGGGCLRVEDNFLVTKDGLEKLSAFPDGVVRC